MSINAKATKRARRVASIASRRSRITRRFGSPVSASCVVSLRMVARLRARKTVSCRAARIVRYAPAASTTATTPSRPHSQFIAPMNARSGAQLNQPTMRPCASCSDCTSRPRSAVSAPSNLRSCSPARRAMRLSSSASKRPASAAPAGRSSSAACKAACCSAATRLSLCWVSVRPVAAQASTASAKTKEAIVPMRAVAPPGTAKPLGSPDRRRAQNLRASPAACIPYAPQQRQSRKVSRRD